MVALISFSDGIYHHRLRDNYPGWEEKERKEKLHLVINNRFLILPWVKVRNLGSRILSSAAKVVPMDWEKRYGYRVEFFKTFVDIDRFSGTVYKAANWKLLGRTEGKGRKGMNYFFHGKGLLHLQIKIDYGKPNHTHCGEKAERRRFRKRNCKKV